VDLSGRWNVRIEYLASASDHVLHLKQNGERVEGTHQGDFVSRDLGGTIDGDQVRLVSSYNGHGDSLPYQFSGKATGDEMSGTLEMGEYLGARWTAKRHQFRTRG
jgi:L-seryl-tRNA(Ser) seleniumtransferase